MLRAHRQAGGGNLWFGECYYAKGLAIYKLEMQRE